MKSIRLVSDSMSKMQGSLVKHVSQQAVISVYWQFHEPAFRCLELFMRSLNHQHNWGQSAPSEWSDADMLKGHGYLWARSPSPNRWRHPESTLFNLQKQNKLRADGGKERVREWVRETKQRQKHRGSRGGGGGCVEQNQKKSERAQTEKSGNDLEDLMAH